MYNLFLFNFVNILFLLSIDYHSRLYFIFFLSSLQTKNDRDVLCTDSYSVTLGKDRGRL